MHEKRGDELENRILAEDLEKLFTDRLPVLREQTTGSSAQDFSLKLGVDRSYVNKIENRKVMPSMRLFFAMCELMQVHPADFFNVRDPAPTEIQEIVEDLYGLDTQERQHVKETIRLLRNKKK